MAMVITKRKAQRVAAKPEAQTLPNWAVTEGNLEMGRFWAYVLDCEKKNRLPELDYREVIG